MFSSNELCAERKNITPVWGKLTVKAKKAHFGRVYFGYWNLIKE